MCSTSATLTLTDAAQATSLVNCTTYTGSIAVSESFIGDLNFVDELQDITGSLNATFVTNLTAISAPGLQTIGGSFLLESLFALTSLSFPSLVAVNEISWIYLGPDLLKLGFSSLNTVSDLTILGSFLQNLEGINLNSAATLSIIQNPYLTNISLPLTSSSNAINISINAYGNSSLHLPNLQTTGELYVSNCSSVNLPSFYNASGTVSLLNNSFETLDLPLLAASGGMRLENNPEISLLSMPLYAVSSSVLSIQNNTSLDGIISLPSLTDVTGDVTLIGTFSNITAPKLDRLRGEVTIQSTQNIASTCANFQGLDGSDIRIRGNLTCTYPGTTVYNPSDTSTSTHGSNHTAPIVAGVVAGVVAIAALLGSVLFVKRRRKRKARKARAGGPSDAELENTTHPGEMNAERDAAEMESHNRVEMDVPQKPAEMMGFAVYEKESVVELDVGEQDVNIHRSRAELE